MDLTIAEAKARFPGHVFAARSIGALYAEDAARPPEERPDLLALEGGLMSDGLAQRFASPAWPLELLSGLRPPEDHGWLFAERLDKDRAMRPEDLDEIRRASGAFGRPEGNVRVTWWIRKYDERGAEIGGLDWFRRVAALNRDASGLAAELLSALTNLLGAAVAAGGALLVEQITVILSKDADSPLRTLTPNLHADEFYGRRETAICSLLEQGWSPRGGALFLPACRMERFAGKGAIDLARLDCEFAELAVVTPASGDVLIYDGMIGADGRPQPALGLPHVSADRPGESARLVILMRHLAPG